MSKNVIADRHNRHFITSRGPACLETRILVVVEDAALETSVEAKLHIPGGVECLSVDEAEKLSMFLVEFSAVGKTAINAGKSIRDREREELGELAANKEQL